MDCRHSRFTAQQYQCKRPVVHQDPANLHVARGAKASRNFESAKKQFGALSPRPRQGASAPTFNLHVARGAKPSRNFESAKKQRRALSPLLWPGASAPTFNPHSARSAKRSRNFESLSKDGGR